MTASMWLSHETDFVALGDPGELRVSGPGVEARLTGNLAAEFLEAFTGDGTARVERIEALGALGSPVHEALAAAARRGGGRPWVALSSVLSRSTLFIELLGRCNERCIHCYADAGPDLPEALDRDTCLRVVREGAQLGFQRLQLTGGDPLLCAFLPELAGEGRAAGFEEVEIYTNGLALSVARLDALAAHGVAFAFSFYSHDAAVHDAITRVPGSQRRTSDAIARVVERGLEVRVSIISMEANAGHLADTRAYLAALGVPDDRISADRVRGVGRGRGGRNLLAAPPPGPLQGGHAAPAAPAEPPRWPGKICVAYTGTVHPCIFSRWIELGRVTDESLASIVHRARTAEGRGGDVHALADRLACLDCRLTALALERGDR